MSHNNLISQDFYYSHFTNEETEAETKRNDLSRVTQLESNRARICTWACLMPCGRSGAWMGHVGWNKWKPYLKCETWHHEWNGKGPKHCFVPNLLNVDRKDIEKVALFLTFWAWGFRCLQQFLAQSRGAAGVQTGLAEIWWILQSSEEKKKIFVSSLFN